jgi:TonB family protein
VSFGKIQRWTGLAAMAMAVGLGTFLPAPASAQAELSRRVKTKVAPAYPDLARRLNVRGTVKVLVVVAPNGTIKESKVIGGNPVLVNAAMDALKKWTFETASEESTGTLEFKFQPQ